MKIAIAKGPMCPNCGWNGFDDWWHDKSCRSPGGPVVDVYANLECECGAKFEVTRYHDGETHSTLTSTPSQAIEKTEGGAS